GSTTSTGWPGLRRTRAVSGHWSGGPRPAEDGYNRWGPALAATPVTHTITRRPAHPFRPWLIALGVVAVGFGVLVLIKPPGSNPATSTDEPFVQPSEPPGPAPDGMVWIPGGPFWMGYDASPDHDAPVHEVAVNGFWMDATEV